MTNDAPPMTMEQLRAGLAECINESKVLYHTPDGTPLDELARSSLPGDFTKPQELYIYCIEPIDFWDGWQRPENNHLDGFAEWCDELLHFAEALDGYDPVRAGPYYAPMPESYGGSFIVGWKRDNNGASWIVAPREMPHLHKEAFIVGYAKLTKNGYIVRPYSSLNRCA